MLPSLDADIRKKMPNAIRALSMDAVEQARSGHPGMPLGMADVACVLFSDFLKFNPQNPDWFDRDRFILSAGHGSMLLYSLLFLTGYKDFSIDHLRNFRQLGSSAPGHPEYGVGKGIETTTGPLGQGLGNAVGMALSERLFTERFGTEIVDHYTYVISGDGCLMEGISHEAISLAGHLGLSKLIVLFDDNQISIDGATNLAVSDNQRQRFEACGWDTFACDGHDPEEIKQALQHARASEKPALIACRTIIGYGSPNKQGTAGVHGAPLGAEEIALTKKTLGWEAKPFEIPESILQAWRSLWKRNQETYDTWNQRFASHAQKNELLRILEGNLPDTLEGAIQDYKKELCSVRPKQATRKSSQETLNILTPVIPELLGGSADLTGSNLTQSKSQRMIHAKDFSGSYVHYGVREHAMASAMNGIALHGGFIPYGGTFLVFSDYCRPAIRLSALMKQRVIYVMTHDSIGLGEDGPTHQPVEHLASLRAMPNLNVFRPCDAVETLECWILSLQDKKRPSLLSLSRQGLPALRVDYEADNLCARGGYVISPAVSKRQITLIASGSEVSLAVKAQTKLNRNGISATVVSMPCLELFRKQDKFYQETLLGNVPRLAIEAGVKMGWEDIIGSQGAFVGMKGFGESAPAETLYEFFGITEKSIVSKAQAMLK